MPAKDRVRVTRRFLRSVRIDADLGDPEALEGFICPRTSAEVLLTMARHISETGHGAFTWTGPYGGGKSSLVIALGALLAGDVKQRRRAAGIFGGEVARAVGKALPPGTKGWRVVPVIGRREDPSQVIGEALVAAKVARPPAGGWNEDAVIRAAARAARAAERRNERGGLAIFIDEMGKFLEAAARDGSDIHVFQQLAEIASRAGGRLLVIGVLHQAFEEYARRFSREMQDEWAKVQGRFIDLAVSASGEEQIELISRAIGREREINEAGKEARGIAEMIRGKRTTDSDPLPLMLERCRPLHPVVVCLLGPMSRRRFGQNQRSVFGFLNSAEPHGLQDFIARADNRRLYGPDHLRDYLRVNLEPSILASPDGHLWALAADAIERCEAVGGDALHLGLLKTIAVVSLFRERSGLPASRDLLQICFPDVPKRTLKKALDQLDQWSLVIFRKHLGAYAIFAGSDFDVDEAVRTALGEIGEIDFPALKKIAGLQPVLAKRHYHDTGAMRWFDVNICPLREVQDVAARGELRDGAIGQFLLAIPDGKEDETEATDLCRKAARAGGGRDVVVGVSKRSAAIVSLARESLALDLVRRDRPELAGDAVARREVESRLSEITGRLELELRAAFDGALWHRKRHAPAAYRRVELNVLASDLADRRYGECPKIHNELLNRQKPSASAISAQNVLLRRMALHEGEERLGIEGWPAEGGLFDSILEGAGLYARRRNGDRCFIAPRAGEADRCRLAPAWKRAGDLVRSNKARAVAVSELYREWRRPPLGIKDGLMPVLAIAFILSRRDKISVYRDGVFRSRLDDVDADYLAKDPESIQIRWTSLSGNSRRLLAGMAEVARDLDSGGAPGNLDPLGVARRLMGVYERLPDWTKRTGNLSERALGVRDVFRRANDPNQFLFDDLPEIVGAGGLSGERNLQRVVDEVRLGLSELCGEYRAMLRDLRDEMFAELQVPDDSPRALAELRKRAENIRRLGGDFQLDAFAGRLSLFDGSAEDFEGIASLAAGRPPRDWVDSDRDRAAINLAELAQKFLRAETFARVKGRPDKRQSIALVIGRRGGRPAPLHEEFQVADGDRKAVAEIVGRVEKAIGPVDASRRNLILAALAEVGANHMEPAPTPKSGGKRRKSS